MVAAAHSRSSLIDDATSALRQAVAHLSEAEQAFLRAGRADLADPTGRALATARLAELLHLNGSGGPPVREPADWFLE
jgi:hypothetical protein